MKVGENVNGNDFQYVESQWVIVMGILQQQQRSHSQIGAMPFPKIQQFKNQIRRTQKQALIAQLRAKLHYQNSDPHQLLSIAQFRDIWKQYLQEPGPLVPEESLRYFSSISFEPGTLDRLLGEVLDCADVCNTAFVSLCTEVCQLNTYTYFTRLTDRLQKQLEIGVVRGKDRTYLLGGIKCIEQVYINYFVKLLNSLTSQQAVPIYSINVWRQYFLNYWDERVDSGTFNFGLCAEFVERLLHFQTVIPEVPKLLEAVSWALVQFKATGVQVYYFMKVYMYHTYPRAPISRLVMSPGFEEFLLQGVEQEPCINPTLLMVQKIFEQPDLLTLFQTNNFVVELMDQLVAMFSKAFTRKARLDLLSGLYNIMFSEIYIAAKWVLRVDFAALIAQAVGTEVEDVLDLGLAALYNFPSFSLTWRLLHSPKFKLLEEANMLVFSSPKARSWKFSKDLLQTLEQVLPHLKQTHSDEQADQAKQLIQHMRVELGKTKEHLEAMDWKHKQIEVQQKQCIIGGFEWVITSLQEIGQATETSSQAPPLQD